MVKKKKKVYSKPLSQPTSQPKNNWFDSIIKNFIAGILILLIGSSFIKKNKSYTWVHETLIKKNLERAEEYKKLTTEEKSEAKIGTIYKYLSIINKETPEDAIIIFPEDSVVDAIDKKIKLGRLKQKTYCSYFIYPRKAVYAKNPEDAENYKKATHVAVANFYGYDKLNYTVNKKVPFGVFPISK